MKILVTGSKGQLGSELTNISKNIKDYTFDFVDIDGLNICSKEEVEAYFIKYKFDYCINCAAYTAVDKSEENEGQAIKVNVDGPYNLAEACEKHGTILIHISTDFVFDGKSNVAYKESDNAKPLNVYGETKLKGEQVVKNILTKYFILRTSWLYSSFGNNFVKTMLRVASERESIGVVDDQIGTPTHAKDLAELIFKIINERNTQYGVYHYSNEGLASWYDFAKVIFEFSDLKVELKPIKTFEYPLPATRPVFTVLNKEKIKSEMNLTIQDWRDSLKECMSQLNELKQQLK